MYEKKLTVMYLQKFVHYSSYLKYLPQVDAGHKIAKKSPHGTKIKFFIPLKVIISKGKPYLVRKPTHFC